MPFQPGYNKTATFTPDSGSASVLVVTGWTLKDGGDVLEVTSTVHSGLDAYIAGISRIDGNVTAYVDSSALWNAANPGILFGAKGTLSPHVGSSTNWIVHVIVAAVNWSSVVNGVVSYNFDYKSDATSGSRTRPS